MTVQEIKLRQLNNQHLMTAADVQSVVRDLCGVQAQFLSNAMHAISIRAGVSPREDDPDLIKSWTIRGTVHVFSRDDLPLFLHEGRNHKLRPRDTLDGDDCITQARKRYFADLIVDSIAAGINTREALKTVCFDRGLTQTEVDSVFDPWGGTIRALCERGVICHELKEKKSFRLCSPFTPMEHDAARLELTRRYFTHYGPATVKDAAYFFGTTQAEIKKLFDRLPVETAVCDGRTYFFIVQDVPARQEFPACLFLAGFDPLMLGYQKTESLYLAPEHLRDIFNLAGIVMPAVLLHGQVAGRWKKNGRKLAVTLFAPVPAADMALIEASAHSLWPDLRSLEFTT